MLALLLLVHHAAASDFPKDTNYVTRQIASCPETGYFFRQEEAPNSIEPLCYLCFCQDDGSATCWKRVIRRCNLKSYQIQKKDTRVRRSPLSLGELFVRDAAREFFNKQSPEQCKPYESSFSDGCPPVDWCIGCTVCDCDANGRWDCHILSFCPDKSGKKQMKKQKAPARNRIAKRRSKSKKSVPLQSTKNPPNNVTKKPIIKPMRRNQAMQSKNQSIINKRKIMPVNGTKFKKFAAVKKTNPKLQARKSIPNNTKVTKNPLIIKKDISTSNPLNIQSSKLKINQNNTVEVAQKVVKQFMSTVQKMMKNFEKKANSTTKPANKVVKKRSMSKQNSKKNVKNLENKHMIRAKHISKSMKNRKQVSKKLSQKTTYKPQNKKQNNNGRNKRQVAINESISDFNFSNYHQDNKQLEKINKTLNFIDNSINTSTTTNSVNEFFEVFTIPLNMDNEFLILDNKTSNDNVNIMNNGSTSNDDYNFTTPRNDNTKSVNTTGISDSWLLDKFTTPFDKQNNSIHTEDMSNIINDSSLSAKYMPNSIATTTTTTNRPEVTEYENRNDSQYEVLISKNNKTFNNITEQYTYKVDTNHTCKFRTLLEKLIATDGNNIPRAPKKPKRYTIMTKIKRLFKKIFHKRMKSNLYHDDLHYDNFEPMSDHKKSGNCKLHSKEKYKLHQKIDLLRNESETILKSIRVIKGLLQVLEINTNKSATIKFNDSYKDIGKLDAIMKNNYDTEEIFTKLSNDQRTQIKYIKENVHIFIKSMGNFATVLEDIIDIVKHHNQDHKDNDTTMRYNDNFKLTSEVKNHKDTTKQKLEKLKKLLLKYNILQNTFVHQIYTMLNNIDTNATSKDNLKPKEHRNRYVEINKTDAIEADSANIIKNIRKLKVLAEKLNASSRKKREAIGDEDAIEYLLILMEYLLKKHPPNNPPLNDGIDLLIDAIKSAPDIEPIRKKVLNYVPDRTIVTRTTSPTNSARNDNTYYKSKTIPQEENRTETTRTKMTEPTHADEDDEVEEDDNEKNYQKFKSFKDSSSQQKDDMLEQNADSTSINPYDKKVKSAHKSESILVRNKGVNRDIDSTTFTSPNSATVLLEVTTEYSTTVPSKVKVNENVDDNFLVDTKANIDWIEANFKEVKQWKAVDPVSTTHKTVTRTSRNKVKHTNNLSDVTKEIEDKKQVKPSAEVTTKKQNNLLNALDYVEKEIEDDVDSREDKFISDTY